MKFTEEGLTGKYWGNSDSAAEAPFWESGNSSYFGKCQFNGIIFNVWRTDSFDYDPGTGRAWIIQFNDLDSPNEDDYPEAYDYAEFCQAIVIMDVYPDVEYLLKVHVIYEVIEGGVTITPVFTVNGAPTTIGFYWKIGTGVTDHVLVDGVLPAFYRPDTPFEHISGLSNNWFSVGHNESIGVGTMDMTYSWPKVGTTEGAYDIFDGSVFDDTVIPPYTDLVPADSLVEPTNNVCEAVDNLLHIHIAQDAPPPADFTYGLAVEIGDWTNFFQPAEVFPIEPAFLVLFDGASDPIPDDMAAADVSGDYRPTSNWESDFPSPAPTSPYNEPAPLGSATFASVFTGISPNGQWDLYIVDTADGDVGTINLGWDLRIITGSDDETFDNATEIIIPATGEGGDPNPEASPYPSSITVAGVTGTVTDVRVTLNGLEHTYIADISVLLVSPTGENFMIMSACLAPP